MATPQRSPRGGRNRSTPVASAPLRPVPYIPAMADGPRLYRPRPRELPSSDEGRLTAALNDDQARAATFGDGPLLVIAGAGTGKTRTLIHRVASLIERGIAPERVLLLTFTRRAASEMLSRAERLVGPARARVHSRPLPSGRPRP